MDFCKIYFHTSTILDWKSLLKEDQFKHEILNSLSYLSSKQLINVYGFVIMLNHMHLILEMKAMNGKEPPHASLMKFTSHRFKKLLSEPELQPYKVKCDTREYQFWQRDPLAIELYSREVIEQKLDYIHANPMQEKWKLSSDCISYKYSSAAFYETGRDDFGFLKHYMDRL